MTAERSKTREDLEIWVAYARGVRPLGQRKALVPSHGGSRMSSALPRPSAAQLQNPRAAPLPPLVIGGQPAGLDHATWQRFRTGRIAPERRLDLHGHTLDRAFHALRAMLASAHAEGVRCVEVITGRGSAEGSGAIRRELPEWLNRAELRVLVLAAAHPHPANPGATRLLLRKRLRGHAQGGTPWCR
jgi:DNA-nicking Smr family endonuclease